MLTHSSFTTIPTFGANTVGQHVNPSPCSASILYGHQLLTWLLPFQPSSLLMSYEGSGSWPKAWRPDPTLETVVLSFCSTQFWWLWAFGE